MWGMGTRGTEVILSNNFSHYFLGLPGSHALYGNFLFDAPHPKYSLKVINVFVLRSIITRS
jgi:hypothetical protein